MRKITFTLLLILAFVLKVSTSFEVLAGVKADPVAHYTFNTDTSDVSGNGYDVTLIGDAKIDSGFLVLDGDGDAAEIPEIGVQNQVTYAMWVYPTDDLTTLEFAGGININSWPTNGIHFKLKYGMLNVGINNFGDDLMGTTVVPTNEWSHIALTISETDANLYLNGVNEGTKSLDKVWDLIVGTACIGAWNDGGTMKRAMAGKMDEVCIYDVALTEEEIGALAATEPTPYIDNKVPGNIAETFKLAIYPNPVKNVLNIKNAFAVEHVEIYDVVGNLVLNVKNNNALKSINVNSLTSGVYLVRSYTSGGVGTSSFIKQ
jgi:hypothetical protein